MQKFLTRLCASFAAVSLFAVPMLAPIAVEAKAAAPVKKSAAKPAPKKPAVKRLTVSAIPGKDEREFENSATRCLTKDMIKLNNQYVATMNADIAKRGDGHEKNVKLYKAKMDILWSAMSEPYCGYGSRGMTAVKKSYIKSFEHIRAEFLAAVK